MVAFKLSQPIAGTPEGLGFALRDEFLPYALPMIGDDEIAEVVDTLHPRCRRFKWSMIA